LGFLYCADCQVALILARSIGWRSVRGFLVDVFLLNKFHFFHFFWDWHSSNSPSSEDIYCSFRLKKVG
jgi:hypothetical protein